MAGLATKMLASKSGLLSMMAKRSLSVGAALKSEVQATAPVPDFIMKKFEGASPDLMDVITTGYSQLTTDEKELVDKIDKPWTALSIQEKQALYDFRYEQSKWEEDDEQYTSHYMKHGSVIWLVSSVFILFNALQQGYCNTSEWGTPVFSRVKTPEWDEAEVYRYAKYNPDPISRNLGGFR